MKVVTLFATAALALSSFCMAQDAPAPAKTAAPAVQDAAPRQINPTALATVAAEATSPEEITVAATVEAGSGWLEKFTDVVNKADDFVWGASCSPAC